MQFATQKKMKVAIFTLVSLVKFPKGFYHLPSREREITQPPRQNLFPKYKEGGTMLTSAKYINIKNTDQYICHMLHI